MKEERLQMLFLLSNFIYFGSRETRELLRCLYRDIFRYRIVEGIRRNNGGTADRDCLRELFESELMATRFLSVGNPSESGSHLLYFFRQENRLGKQHFINSHEIFHPGDLTRLRDPQVRKFVFLDDLCGSGKQAESYCRDIVAPLKAHHPGVQALYYVLYACSGGLAALRALALFDDVDCVFELDESFKAFADGSLVYLQANSVFDRPRAKAVAEAYGVKLAPRMALGYKDGQLLLGFSHNVPDNTLPVFWYDEPNGPAWNPVFPRYPKSYGWGQG